MMIKKIQNRYVRDLEWTGQSVRKDMPEWTGLSEWNGWTELAPFLYWAGLTEQTEFPEWIVGWSDFYFF